MKRRITIVNGMPVEIPELDEIGETERTRLNAAALEEFEAHGTLVGEELQRVNAEFADTAKQHVLGNEEESV